MLSNIPIAFAGLMGAAGVALAAAAAHAKPGMGLEGASQILLFHAVAILAASAARAQGLLSRRLGLIALIAFACGAVLFSGDIVSRAYLGTRLFPMAAPTGGSLLMGGWLLLAAAALTPRKS
jgi:uncharacterized membrane protein YgdD (TMEM256/DUF423 family)